MKQEIPICKDCGQPMLEVGGIGKREEIGEWETPILENWMPSLSRWKQTGIREIKLYQCPECKEVKLA